MNPHLALLIVALLIILGHIISDHIAKKNEIEIKIEEEKRKRKETEEHERKQKEAYHQ